MKFLFLSCFLALTQTGLLSQVTAPAKKKDISAHALLVHLESLGYWVDPGSAPTTTQNKQAITAFQKLNGFRRTGVLSDKIISAIWNATPLCAKDSIHLRHIEIDLDHQVLFLLNSSDHIERILTISTGNGKKFLYPEKGWEKARTPRGQFKVYYKISGWRKSKLGMLFDPLYITGGIAIHGASNVPPVPASHGCIRIPLFAADEMFRTTPIGTPVIIYGQNSKSD